MIDTIEIQNGTDEHIEITLRGTPTHVVSALVNGLPHEDLLQLQQALSDELAKRESKKS